MLRQFRLGHHAAQRRAALGQSGRHQPDAHADAEFGQQHRHLRFFGRLPAAAERGRVRRSDRISGTLAETVELARALGQLPQQLVIYLIEGEQFDTGAPLSPRVAEAVERAADAIRAELSDIAAKG